MQMATSLSQLRGYFAARGARSASGKTRKNDPSANAQRNSDKLVRMLGGFKIAFTRQLGETSEF